jgi:preprotein translocase subunit SecA
MLAQLLSEYKLSYQILNAKPENVRRESEIVAQAGKSTITIATNMAGRGTDIILGGNINFKIKKEL